MRVLRVDALRKAGWLGVALGILILASGCSRVRYESVAYERARHPQVTLAQSRTVGVAIRPQRQATVANVATVAVPGFLLTALPDAADLRVTVTIGREEAARSDATFHNPDKGPRGWLATYQAERLGGVEVVAGPEALRDAFTVPTAAQWQLGSFEGPLFPTLQIADAVFFGPDQRDRREEVMTVNLLRAIAAELRQRYGRGPERVAGVLASVDDEPRFAQVAGQAAALIARCTAAGRPDAGEWSGLLAVWGAIARDGGDARIQGAALYDIGFARLLTGALPEARASLEQALAKDDERAYRALLDEVARQVPVGANRG
jgi:hypothetical protein